jgi:hypothetical protein
MTISQGRHQVQVIRQRTAYPLINQVTITTTLQQLQLEMISMTMVRALLLLLALR